MLFTIEGNRGGLIASLGFRRWASPGRGTFFLILFSVSLLKTGGKGPQIREVLLVFIQLIAAWEGASLTRGNHRFTFAGAIGLLRLVKIHRFSGFRGRRRIGGYFLYPIIDSPGVYLFHRRPIDLWFF
jgi:hypothetical protein